MAQLQIFSLMIFIILSSFQEGSEAGVCGKSRGAARPIKRSIGGTVQLLCPHFGCEGSSYNFTHYSPVTGEANLIHQGSHTHTWRITSLSDAGDYCCSKQCDVDHRQCCITVEVTPMMQWRTLPEAVVVGSSVTSGCRATGYPRPSVDVINNCIDQYQHNVIDEYTSEVEFTIKSITKNCQHIYCYTSSTYEEQKLLIVDNMCDGQTPVTSTNKVTRSVEPATTTNNIQTHSGENTITTIMYMMSLIILPVIL